MKKTRLSWLIAACVISTAVYGQPQEQEKPQKATYSQGLDLIQVPESMKGATTAKKVAETQKKQTDKIKELEQRTFKGYPPSLDLKRFELICLTSHDETKQHIYNVIQKLKDEAVFDGSTFYVQGPKPNDRYYKYRVGFCVVIPFNPDIIIDEDGADLIINHKLPCDHAKKIVYTTREDYELLKPRNNLYDKIMAQIQRQNQAAQQQLNMTGQQQGQKTKKHKTQK